MNMECTRAGLGRGARAIIGAALLLGPVLAVAQSSSGTFTAGSLTNRPVPKLVCVYKGVMSDAEIEACTGYRVQYRYGLR